MIGLDDRERLVREVLNAAAFGRVERDRVVVPLPVDWIRRARAVADEKADR